MPLVRWLVVALLMLLGLLVVPTQAQAQSAGSVAQPPEALANSLKAARSLSTDQQQVVRQYISQTLAILKAGGAEQIRAGREALLDPYGSAASSEFKAFYGDAVLGELAALVENSTSAVQLNAAIVAAEMQRPAALPLARAVLKVDNAAVRYWGGQILRQLAARGQLSAEQRQTLIELVDGLLEGELSTRVVEPALLALTALNTEAADRRVLSALDQRIAVHVNTPELSYDGERAAMQALFRRLAQRAAEQSLAPDAVRPLARVACRYMLLIATQGQAGAEGLTDHREASLRRTIEFTNRVLQWSATELDAADAPAPVGSNDDWQKIQRAAEAWQTRLLESPYGIDQQQLALPG
jgi:hypothetical protein